MQSILNQIWNGKVKMLSYEIREKPKYRELAERHVRAIAEMEELLTEDMKVTLRQMIMTHDELSAYCEKEMIMYAFKLGVNFERTLHDATEKQNEK